MVIPAYDEQELLPATLESVAASMAQVGGLGGEAIVVDNNSTDLTAQIAAERGTRVVFERHRQIARARNAGAAAAAGRYLIVVDADTRISPALLARTLWALDAAGFCGGGANIVFDCEMSAAGVLVSPQPSVPVGGGVVPVLSAAGVR